MIKNLEYYPNINHNIIDAINKLIDIANEKEELDESYFEMPKKRD